MEAVGGQGSKDSESAEDAEFLICFSSGPQIRTFCTSPFRLFASIRGEDASRHQTRDGLG